VITPALLHPEVGAVDRCRPGAILQACELEEVLEEVQWALIPRYPSHIALNATIC
jgi:hypothetical protein